MLVMTMMVRDEADIIAATIEHHLAQGIDHLIVTDNASVDGTAEILEEYSAHAPITLLHDAEHRKQQAEVVTRMARSAHALGARWVINGDADEFVLPRDSSRTLADIFAELDTGIGAFQAPVTNLIGPIAVHGAGLDRLVLRDDRPVEALQALGVHAHPTPNAIHAGSPDVEVSQGNHSTSIPQTAPVPDELEVEVLHLPWRSVAQFERKTENLGRGYEASPHLRPSPSHHGMRDWRRMQGGMLLPFLARRMPTIAELEHAGLTRDLRVVEGLRALGGDAVLERRLEEALHDGDALPDHIVLEQRAIATRVAPYEALLLEQLTGARLHTDGLERRVAELDRDLEGLRRDLEAARLDAAGARAEVEVLERRVAEVAGTFVGRVLLKRAQR